MAQLITLLIVLTGLLIICLLTTKRALITPQFGFIACFIPGIVYSFAYVHKWDLDLSSTTVWVIIIGTSMFFIVSTIWNKVIRRFRKKKKKTRNHTTHYMKNGNIPNWKFYIIILLQSLTLVLTVFFLVRNYGNTLSTAMFAYRRLSVSGDDYIMLPGAVKALRRICIAAGFVTSFLLVRGMVYRNNKKILFPLVCTILSMLNGMVLGARGDAIQILVGGIIQYMEIYSIKTGGKTIKLSSFLKIFIIITIIILSFSSIGELMGRSMSFLKFGDYIAVYLSAELKNLDTFIRTGNFGAPISDSQTMANISKLLSIISGNPSIEHSLTNPYRFINGYALGNVSTTFYAFLYDMGIVGVGFFTSIMAIICQQVYTTSLKAEPQKRISVSIIIYSFLWYTIVFSFFSDKFYEMVFNTAFIWYVVGVLLVKSWFELNLKIKKR